MEITPGSRRNLRDRQRNLCKKANELSTLCGTDVCMIIFRPHTTEPETWPKDFAEVHRILRKYKANPAIKDNHVKGTTSHSVIRPRGNSEMPQMPPLPIRSTFSDEPNKKTKSDLNVSDSYDSKIKGKKKLHADYDSINSEEVMDMQVECLTTRTKLSKYKLIGDDEAKLASLEAQLQAITEKIALRELPNV